jgi:hypothetical protein
MGFNCIKPLAERQHSGKPRPLDGETRLGHDPARILKRMLDKAVAAGLKRHDICHYPIPISVNLKRLPLCAPTLRGDLDRQPAGGQRR